MHASFGLEGLVSKRRDRPYQAGRSKHWVKVKNRGDVAGDGVIRLNAGIDSSQGLRVRSG
jgi:ATP-dependent DNA ligase